MIPYVEKVSETIVRIMKKHNVPVAMKPWKTIKDLLVHPKDKQDKEDIIDCAYKVPWANCDKRYVGETGRKLGIRLHEHKTKDESKTERAFTRSQRTASLTEYTPCLDKKVPLHFLLYLPHFLVDFTIFSPKETGLNTPKCRVIYLLNSLMTS